LNSVVLYTTTLWSGSEGSSPVTIPDATHPMSGTGSIPANNTVTLTLTFDSPPMTYTVGDNTIQFTLSSGCQVTGHN
jgi:hypothetical protein